MIDIKHFKDLLLDEKRELETELKSIGRRNPNNKGDWEAVEPEVGADSADVNEVADEIEAYEENSAVLKQEEIQYNNVVAALKKIEVGTYGKCEIGGEEIPVERLEAEPSAKTCMNHKM